MWHGLRNDIIMRYIIYAEGAKKIKYALFWRQSICKRSRCVNRDLKHRRRNGTTTPTGREIFPREPSGHASGCQNVVQPSSTTKFREVCRCHLNVSIKVYFLRVNHSFTTLSFSKSGNTFFVD